MTDYAIGVDIGGTNCRAALVDSSGRAIHEVSSPVGSSRSQIQIIRLLERLIRDCLGQMPPEGLLLGIGIGAPGITEFNSGTIIHSPHFPDWVQFPLKESISKLIDYPVIVDNDVNIAAIGELWQGSLDPDEDFIYITLGTGIGGAIMIDGKIYHGRSGFAGEIGHIVVEMNGPACSCGGRGCVERYASASGFPNLLKQAGIDEHWTPEKAFELAEKSHEEALALWELFGQYLACALASAVHLMDIERVIVAGGLAHAWKYFSTSLVEGFRAHTYHEISKRVIIKQSQLVDRAGVLGGAKLWF